MRVVDASVLVPALADDGAHGGQARRALSGVALAAPELIDLEVLSAVRSLLRGGQLSDRRALSALASLARARIVRSRHRPLLQRIWELRDNLSAYDASYVALAEALDTSLITADRGLARAPGVECEVVLIG